jgi:hypothetical protein
VIVSVPDHWPRFAVSVEPTAAVPEMVGGDVFRGATRLAAVPTPARTTTVVIPATTRATAAATRPRFCNVLMLVPLSFAYRG